MMIRSNRTISIKSLMRSNSNNHRLPNTSHHKNRPSFFSTIGLNLLYPIINEKKNFEEGRSEDGRKSSLNRKEINKFMDRPSPPPLPLKDQIEFENLIRKNNQPILFEKEEIGSKGIDKGSEEVIKRTDGESDGLKGSEDLRKLPPVEFEGEVNPKTGEIGGPKREPLRWEREWSYGGRATDF